MINIKRIYFNNKALILNIFGAFAIKGVSLCLSLLTMPAYIRFFNNQTILGVWFTIISVLSWILHFDLGLGNGLRNKLPEVIEAHNYQEMRQLISTTYTIMTVLIILFGIIGLLLIPIIDWNKALNIGTAIVNGSVLRNCIIIVYFGILLQFVQKIVSSVLYALQKSAIVNCLSLVSSLIIVGALLRVPSSSIETNLYTMAIINVVAMTLPYFLISVWVYGRLLNGAFPRFRFFNKNYVKDLLGIGVSLLWLQIILMVISSVNEYLISVFTLPKYVVEYQAYNKIFKLGAMVFSLALTPIWSAVTKAQAEKNYIWIKKVYKFFLLACFACFAIELAIVPFSQLIMDIWLREGSFAVSTSFGIVFAFSGTIFVIHNVNTSIGNGLSYFKIQMIWLSIAAILDIPLCYLLVHVTDSWVGIIVANVMVLLPYEILAPIYTFKLLNSKIKNINGIV